MVIEQLYKVSDHLELAASALEEMMGSLDDVQDEEWGADVQILASRIRLIQDEVEVFADEL